MFLGERWVSLAQDDGVYQFDFAHEKLTKHFATQNLKGFGVENLKHGIVAAGAVMALSAAALSPDQIGGLVLCSPALSLDASGREQTLARKTGTV